MVFRKFPFLAVLAAGLLSDSGGQKLTGSGKDYLQQTEQGPWFTGSCKFPVSKNHDEPITYLFLAGASIVGAYLD